VPIADIQEFGSYQKKKPGTWPGQQQAYCR
jgi:hypothetical protein